MPFVVPQMPLLCDIYSGPWLSKALKQADVACNLAWGKRIQAAFAYGASDTSALHQCPMTLLLPALTEIWDGAGLTGDDADIVEVPSGTGRWYCVFYVDDIGKGFPNEHRAAIIFKLYEAINPPSLPGLSWPNPIP